MFQERELNIRIFRTDQYSPMNIDDHSNLIINYKLYQ